MKFLNLNESDNGYGELDKQLADNLRSVKNQEEADEIARKDGHKDSDDAVKWLKERS